MSGPIIVGELRKNARERVRVALDQWQGHDLLDLRVTTQLSEATGIWSPTKKGLSINIALLPAMREMLAEAEAKARAMGLIGGEA